MKLPKFTSETTLLFYAVFLLHLAVRELFQFFQEAQVEQISISIGFTLLLSMFIFFRNPKINLAIASGTFVLLFYKFSNTFPTCSNHFYIEFLISFFYLLYSTQLSVDSERREIFQDGIIKIVAFIFIAAGLQKLFAGTYMSTSFLAVQIFLSDSFSQMFKYINPQDVERIKGLEGIDSFYLTQPLGKYLSYSIPFVELFAGILIAFKKTRVLGFFICLFSILGVELFAREFLFGLLYILCAGLVFKASRFRKLSLAISVSYLILILVHFLSPNFHFN